MQSQNIKEERFMFNVENKKKSLAYVMYYAKKESQEQYLDNFKETLKKHDYRGSLENVLVKTPYVTAINALSHLQKNVSDDELMNLLDETYSNIIQWKREMMKSYKGFRKMLQSGYDNHMSVKSRLAC